MELKLQLLFAFIILSFITLIAILLTILSKNSRSHKIRNLSQQHKWQYQEFVNFTETIKQANFGLLNYSQNIIFRHIISADKNKMGFGFNFFDCRAIEPMDIHNCSSLLFNLDFQQHPLQDIHVCFSPKSEPLADTRNASAFGHSGIDKKYFDRIRAMQKLKRLTSLFPFDYAFPKHEIYTNNSNLLESFLEQHVKSDSRQHSPLTDWLLAHPNLHIEISNGMLLAYQPNHLLNDDEIIPAIEHITELAKSLSQTIQ